MCTVLHCIITVLLLYYYCIVHCIIHARANCIIHCTVFSKTVTVLERNREMAKPQKMGLFVAQFVFAEFGPACVMSIGVMCYRSGDVPPALLLHVHTINFEPVVLTTCSHRISM